MAEIKTKKTDSSVAAFIDTIPEERHKDAKAISKMMQDATGCKPKMWGGSIIGFGDYRYKSERTGREVDWFIMGFSPRKAAFSLYIMGKDEKLMAKLGKYKMGKGCLYVNKLGDVDTDVLKKIMALSVAYVNNLGK